MLRVCYLRLGMMLSYPLQNILSFFLANLSPLNKELDRNYNGSLLFHFFGVNPLVPKGKGPW